jgi:mono/diheme cytochrome c family protein
MSLSRAALALCLVVGCDRQVAGGKADGQAVFGEVCARCHGDAGRPTEGMMRAGVRDLTATELTAADIAAKVRDGAPDKGMPGFGGQLTEEQIAAVAAHVLTLSGE